jgi:DNA polymerase-3 subunit epsilon/ATP-dependent DNA helicase DinG
MATVYVALDLETTGLDPARDVIIEVAAVKFVGRRELDRLSSLVRPGRQIPIQVSQLTGITDRDVLDAPPFAALKGKLSTFVGQAAVVGHNVGFDLGFLRRQGCLAANRSIDTFTLATILMPNQNRYSLGKLADSLEIAFSTRHRALDDAVATMQLFWALMDRACGLPAKTLLDLNRIASKSRWPLQGVFQEAERQQVRSGPHPFREEEALLTTRARPRSQPIPEPLHPVEKRTLLDVARLSAMIEQGGALSRAFEGFEHRPQQVEMLGAVAKALNGSQHLLVEAGTGVGKSIAYLLPAIHWAVQNGERVVISTNTINLQDQLIGKDVPDLRALLPFDVRAALLKGRSNYLCKRRLGAFQERLEKAGTPTEDELTVLARILAWLPQTTSGDRSELVLYGARAQEVWAEVSADANSCTGAFCPFFRRNKCFFYAARQAAESAHLIVVNHALLLSDVAADNRVLPAYNYLIVDEAHHLESATTYQLGHAMTQRNILNLLARIGRDDSRLAHAPEGGYLGSVLGRCRGRVPEERMGEIEDNVLSLYERVGRLVRGQQDLFEDLTAFVSDQLGNKGPYDQRLRLSRELRLQPEWEQIEVVWANQSDDLEATIAELAHLVDLLGDLSDDGIPGHADLVQDGTAHLRQLGTVYAHLESVLMASQHDSVTWIRTRARRGAGRGAGKRDKGVEEVSLCAVPLRVDDLVEQHLLWPKEAVIFTSATLRTSGDFSFIKERLGARDAHELAVGSPFDHEAQVLLYLPTDMPEPNEPYHQQRMNQSLMELAVATRGRMLGLFTSYSQLRAASKAISRPLAGRGITVYTQGQGASRSQLLESFRETPQAVLLGTRSFWEGVDVPGEALSCLVIAKLPFAVPSDPVYAARSEEMDDPFYQYMVPDAILHFRQGFGRLIRTKTDRGVVVLMDKRLQTKRYGELFLESLPRCTVIRGALADLPQSAAMWIDEGRSLPGLVERSPESKAAGPEQAELEYVSFDDLD